ncbi:MAG: cell division protein FtsZ, partial [Clostridium chrysemydis]
EAISSPLLETSIEGATGVILNFTGGADLGALEVYEAADVVRESVDADANIIFGAVIDENLNDEIRITVIATGFEEDMMVQDKPQVVIKKPVETKKVVENVVEEVVEEVATTTTENEEKSSYNDEDLSIPTFLRRRKN